MTSVGIGIVSISFVNPSGTTSLGCEKQAILYIRSNLWLLSLSNDRNAPGVSPTAEETELIKKIKKEFHLR